MLKKLISLCALVALSGTSCWGASQRASFCTRLTNAGVQLLYALAGAIAIDDYTRAAELTHAVIAAAGASTATGEDFFENLPDDVILHIAQSLDTKSLMQMNQVSKRFNQIATEILGKQLIAQHVGNLE